MEQESKRFFESLLATPGISGFEEQVQAVVRDYVEPFAQRIDIDLHGNLIAAINMGQPTRVMLAGHCDQIGLLVSQIDENGFIYTQTVGGWDPIQLVGQRVVIGGRGGPVSGVISRKAIHLQNEEERKQLPKAHELWVDIGASDVASVRERVSIGDPITLKMGHEEVPGEIVFGPAMDDRCGVWVVMEALRRVAGESLASSVYAVSTVQEEIGLRGAKTAAYRVDPAVAIAVDVTHATDCPGIDRRAVGDVSLGKGPVIFRGPNINERIAQRLIDLARKLDIPHQIAALGRAAPNDSNSLQVSRAGVATGLVSIPNRYMHSPVEMISLNDIDAAANLLAEFIRTVTNAEEFTPLVATTA